jgi:hypothetical protein
LAPGSPRDVGKKLKEAVGNYYWSAPTADDLKGTSYRLTDFVEETVEVWDENWDVICLFTQYSSQWRTAMNGPIGLDFNVFHHALDRKGIAGEDYDEWILKLGIIEAEALKQLNRK